VTVKFGYTIFYVDNVEGTVSFYERAFGFKRGMLAPDEFGVVETGATKLGFAANAFMKTALPLQTQTAGMSNHPPPVEIALVTDDVQAAFDKAVAAGAKPVSQPKKEPRGQVVSYVRDLNGFLIEICTPI
jgi:lactoylglutathione lyase